jgi:hypothetical protein
MYICNACSKILLLCDCVLVIVGWCRRPCCLLQFASVISLIIRWCEGGGGDERSLRSNGRIGFRTRSEVEILDDGFKWRKYGKKAVKNSPNPRYYYTTQIHMQINGAAS